MSKKVIEQRVVNEHGFVFETTETEHKGIFFRSPIQMIDFENDYFSDNPRSAGELNHKLKNNALYRWFNILMGNKNIVKNLNKWIDEMDFAGVNKRCLVLPIYFKRLERSLKATNVSNSESDINEVISKGFESPYEIVAGCCKIERTKFTYKNGKSSKVNHKEQYHYTYQHVIEEEILGYRN